MPTVKGFLGWSELGQYEREMKLADDHYGPMFEKYRNTSVTALIGDKDAVYPLAGAAAALVGPIDLLIHNASTLGATPLPLLLDTACEDLERVLAVNVIGPFRLSKIIAGSMALRGKGLLVHISQD